MGVEARKSTRADAVALTKAVVETHITDQCTLFARPEQDFRVDMLVNPGEEVAQGAPVLRSRRHPSLTLVAPVAGTVAGVDLGPGRRLSQVLFFHLPDGERHVHDVRAAENGTNASATRSLLLSAGLWTYLRSRPFGRLPSPDETPAAIFVMALDTRPDAPPPALTLKGRLDAFARGLQALVGLTSGPVHVCHDGTAGLGDIGGGNRIRLNRVEPVHPLGLPGMQIASRFPAATGKPVWDIHAEDAAGIGEFLATGLVPETRMVSVSGPALREKRLVRCQPGADLRALTFDIVRPGPHRLMSGSALDGMEGRWLGSCDRQVAAIAAAGPERRPHWFSAALRRSSRPLPIIPTAALDHAFGGILPAAPLVRAIAANDTETAIRLGALSLIEEDVALADYVTAASPRLAVLLRGMLDWIADEEVS